MKILGIEFASLNIPLERRLQTLAVATWFLSTAFGGPIFSTFCFYFLFTKFWWLVLLYAVWIYLDRNICETGGRSLDFVRNWRLWLYAKNYFPSNLVLVPNFTLDPKRNYLFCCFPHGIIPAGPGANIFMKCSGFTQLYPNFTVKYAILKMMFFMPLIRELYLGLGGISPSAKAISYVLKRPEGGHVVLLMPGGAAEAYNCRSGVYKIIVKKRKGFVKVALKCGSALVPVLTFGECDLFEQIEAGPILQKIQKCFKNYLGFSLPLFCGRGFFQYSFGLIPRRKPLTTIVGASIEVAKEENPTDDQIDELHRKFVQQLVDLFEEYKHKYLENPQNTHLELE